MKKPRSVGEKKVEAKKRLPEQTEQNLAKSVGRQDRYSCEQVRTDLFSATPGNTNLGTD